MNLSKLAGILLVAGLVMLLVGFCCHGAEPDARARAALALAMAQAKPAHTTCNCFGSGDCDCNSDCECPNCQKAKDAKFYRETCDSAIETQRQVVFWVGDCYCGPCRFKLKQAIHCRLSKWFGSDKGGVIVCRPVGQKLIVVQSWEGLPSVEEIAAALAAPTPTLYAPGTAPAIVGGGGCPTCPGGH